TEGSEAAGDGTAWPSPVPTTCSCVAHAQRATPRPVTPSQPLAFRIAMFLAPACPISIPSACRSFGPRTILQPERQRSANEQLALACVGGLRKKAFMEILSLLSDPAAWAALLTLVVLEV